MPRDEIRLASPEKSLKTPRLLLEPLVVPHAAKLYDYLSDRRLYAFIPQDPPVSAQALEDRYRKLSARRSPDGGEAWLNWAIRLRGVERYAGVLEATVRGDGAAFIAYTIFVPYQGRGFAREGCKRLLSHLFQDYGVSTIVAEVDTRNAASIALVEALGFASVSYRQNADHFGGASSDEYRYELRRRED